MMDDSTAIDGNSLAAPKLVNVHRILIIKWSAMGDVVLATACMEDIRRAFPQADIDLSTTAPWHQLFSHDPRFRRVFTSRFDGKGRGIIALITLAKHIAKQRYDLIVDFQSNDRSRLLMSLLWLSRFAPRYRLGNHRRAPYNLAPEPLAPTVHALEQLRASLRAAGIAAPTDRPVLFPAEEHIAHAEALLSANDVDKGSYAVFLPGCQAAGYLKRWGWRNYAAMAYLLRDRGMQGIVLLGGADEREECARIKQACGDWVVDLSGQTQLLDIVPLCAGARYIVANDTGTGHIASATGRPLAVVCGPTDPRRVRPGGRNVTTLQAALFCINCYHKHCTHHSCMTLITPDQVLSQLEQLTP